MFCIAENHERILFENDYTQRENRSDELFDMLQQLPGFLQVGEKRKEECLTIARICDSAAVAFGSRMTVSADKSGAAVRFLMVQRLFGSFLPSIGEFPKLLTLATGFVVTPAGEDVCVSIDFALTERLSSFLSEQASRDLQDFT